MMKTKQNQYRPETVSHPGATLSEKLSEIGMGPKEFAIRTGKPEKTISSILSGDSAITSDMAVLFEDVLKIPATFWLNRQKQYDEALARQKRCETIEQSVEWAKLFPYADMAKLGWVNATRKSVEKVEYLFKFFSIGNKNAFEDYYFNQKLKVSFRVSLAYTKKPYAFAAWLRQGELQAADLNDVLYNEKTLVRNLPRLKELMANQPEDFFKQLQCICLEAGVKVVYTPCLPGATVHGSTRWIKDTPIVQLSARYKQNDIFWFTFFHEIAHILKHGKKYVALENVDYEDQDLEKEKEADDFAIEWTFSNTEEEEVLGCVPLTEEDIVAFSKKFNTHPALIIGRFHHKGLLHYGVGRKFIQKINLSEMA
ncbi:MAG: ImmA/IrrE family metallo-endopeptidase [Cytophagales bacterium]|nr:ImmA/IrrE family metallo-endopeptidase [Cytophagales bacterium]